MADARASGARGHRPCGGSSPHARGAHPFALANISQGRIIPACAGSTLHERYVVSGKGDHPRMRGEHPRSMRTWTLVRGSSPHARGARQREAPSAPRMGSSPHARGAREHGARRDDRPGIIPACAGSTSGRTPSNSCSLGSSPHARGARRRRGGAHQGRGIIPACAGSTSPAPWPSARAWDHPRMRGEHSMPIA